MKTQLRPDGWIYDTSWLPEDCSFSDGDWTVMRCKNGKARILRMELKHGTPPLLNHVQGVLFRNKMLHILCHPEERVLGNGKRSFESPWFQIWCPWEENELVRVDRGWKLQGDHLNITKAKGWLLFTARIPWPCCDQWDVVGEPLT